MENKLKKLYNFSGSPQYKDYKDGFPGGYKKSKTNNIGKWLKVKFS
jgi:hypothetical protein